MEFPRRVRVQFEWKLASVAIGAVLPMKMDGQVPEFRLYGKWTEDA